MSDVAHPPWVFTPSPLLAPCLYCCLGFPWSTDHVLPSQLFWNCHRAESWQAWLSADSIFPSA